MELAVHPCCRLSNRRWHRALARTVFRAMSICTCCRRNNSPWRASVVRRGSSGPGPLRWALRSSRSTRRTSCRSRADRRAFRRALCTVDRPIVCRIRSRRSASCAMLVLPPRCTHLRGLSGMEGRNREMSFSK